MVRWCPEGLSSASSPHPTKDKRFESLIALFCEHEHIFWQPRRCVLLSAARWAESRINYSPSFTASLPPSIPRAFVCLSLLSAALVGTLWRSMSWEGKRGLSSTRWSLVVSKSVFITLLRFIYDIVNVSRRNTLMSLSFARWVKLCFWSGQPNVKTLGTLGKFEMTKFMENNRFLSFLGYVLLILLTSDFCPLHYLKNMILRVSRTYFFFFFTRSGFRMVEGFCIY